MIQFIKDMPPGRAWAYTGVILGVSASIAGNVANTVLFQSDSVPGLLRIVLAVFWPAALFVAIEILTRTDWQQNWKHWIARAILLGPMALVAAIVSYGHLHHLMLMAGENGTAQGLGPLAIDGTLFGSTIALLVTRGSRVRIPVIPQDQDSNPELTEDPVRISAVIPESPAPVIPEPVRIPALPRIQDPAEDSIPEIPVSPAPIRERIPARSSGSWDVPLAVKLLLDPNPLSNEQIGDQVGIGRLTIQRARRAVALLREDPRAEVPKEYKVPAAVVDVIRREVTR